MNKTVLVTGASRGIGAEIARVYADAGYTVLVPARSELNLLDVKNIYSYINSLNKKPGILINNAGVNDIALLEDLTDENIENTLSVNLKAQLHLIKAVAPHMKKNKWGRIVNVSSVWGEFSKSGRVIYSMSKAGVNGLTVSSAVELGPDNILVNALAPGFVDTELTRKNNTLSAIAQITEGLPLKRLAAPVEIARAALWLGSADNTFITGQVIYADGGFSCV